MKKLYRMIMSRGEDFVFQEALVEIVMEKEEQILKVEVDNRKIWINKAHIVCVFLDREETSREGRKEYQPNLPPENEIISLEKITELKNKAKQLALKMVIKEKPLNELKTEAVDKLKPDDLPF